MAGTYTIQEGSQEVMGNNKKTGMTVTFSDGGENSVTCYHEIESVDETVIAEQLQLAADEYASRFEEVKVEPVL